MRKAQIKHDSELWERLSQIIKTEEPVTLNRIREWCADVPLSELENVLREMTHAGRVSIMRKWKNGTLMSETYSYLGGTMENIALDDVRTPSDWTWRQLSFSYQDCCEQTELFAA